ncbi:hypothetical protein TVAG_409620 [Trichomonas vaginalis G3]|uniref:Uncharacterized protein n=1 Tax=Trichomonas vaginalis (strain ATCC PRA-98 / G3) TaxID=412133 RepID=A2F8C2_TRIV3|nr:glycine-rich protein family [Trichomonas vaginalis G3]EAX98824.1 hypothetical protein TVAG_409620 [Trichomonas vaginalis G3]KAI5532255.1 glycine-rich protein family [Trichomonas vaginalis G3]|eukprot:XP_001311754.1 hypothetical protein [Trichomonas vaginalis G3]
MSVPDVTIGSQINYGSKYRFTFFRNTYFQLIFYHDVRTEDYYFSPTNVTHCFGRYRYSLLSDLEKESIYKSSGKYEFLIHYPELTGNNYNWWRQSISPNIQTEKQNHTDENDHYVIGYENVSVYYTQNYWGGLALNALTNKLYLNGCINSLMWYYGIGAYGVETGIPGPSGATYLKRVALYAKINSLDMI